jgi:hypothetical protein
MRLWTVIPHVSLGLRTANGAASGGVRCGSYRDGQLVIHCVDLGTGAYLRPSWQSSVDGQHWGLLVQGVTMVGTGIQILSPLGSIGAWCRMQ